MGVLVWLAVPAGATVLALGWVRWAGRTRGPVETEDSVAQYQAFKRAIEAPVGAGRRFRRRAS